MSFSMNSDDQNDLLTEINVTPFVDVVLVLLILVMLAAPVVYQTAVKVDLPVAKSVTTMNHITLQLFITSEGSLFIDRQNTPLSELRSIVQKTIALDPQADLLVSADKKVSYGRVLEIIDLFKSLGIKNIGLGAKIAK